MTNTRRVEALLAQRVRRLADCSEFKASDNLFIQTSPDLKLNVNALKNCKPKRSQSKKTC